MEVLMKLKCSSTPAHPQQRLNSLPAPTMNCCSTINAQNGADYMNLRAAPNCCTPNSYCGTGLPACCSVTYTPPLSFNNSTISEEMVAFDECKYEYKEPEENFVSIDDVKIKGFLMKIGQEQREKAAAEEAARKLKDQRQSSKPDIVYEIIDLDDEEEREKLKRIKNQADTDTNIKHINQLKRVNEDILQQVHYQQQQQLKNSNTRQSPSISLVPAKYQNDVAEKRKQKKDLPLRIIAKIELLDSSDDEERAKEYEYDEEEEDEEEPRQDEGNHEFQVMSDEEGNDALVPAVLNEHLEDEEDEDIPLAASAVSCELECDDNDDYEQSQIIQMSKNNKKKDRGVNTILGSDNDNDEYIDENEEGLVVRWDDLEVDQEQRNTRNNYECFLCGKRVQSNYNLRRHMMIHTGERPFGCDLCERRFREFSDLKKHRRRHAGYANFMCMICRIKPPTECDPTRCETCDPKMGAVVALRQTNSEASAKVSKNVTVLQKKITPPIMKAPITTVVTTAPSKTMATVTAHTPTTITIQKIKNNNNSFKSNESQLPPLTPIKSFEDQLVMLDTIPAVHRSVYSKGLGMVRRKEFPCPMCQRPFGTRHNLKRHFMIHTGEKPFSCERCRKPFREYSTLKKHMITHARERWYKCLRCPDKFLDYLEYMKHKNIHPDETNGSGGEDASASTSSSASVSAQSSPTKRARQSSYKQDDSVDSQDDFDDDDDDDDDDDNVDDDGGYEDDETRADCLECCECGQRFTDIDIYTDHLKAHDLQVMYYECFVCKQSLGDLSVFEKHMKEVHGAVVSSENEEEQEQENKSKLVIMPVGGNKKRMKK